ncbi:hypothetical protein [Streptomyces sp. TE5632]
MVRSGCVECGQEAEDPAVVGWLDIAGTFTPGALPTDAGPCDAGCVDTVCRTLCDDTDGDGQADTTYSELWCIRANGVAELVLTYQDDPSQEYAPIAPVDCEYGCPESETVPLCDTAPDGTVTPFLRRYRFIDGTATYEDVALDGQTAYIVTGTVGSCDSTSACAEQTTPAATLGLCLADGTPIAVVVTRDCDGTITRDGWLDLTSGAWSAGAPPAGTIACGDSRSITVAGTFCDVDPDGDVLGLVLVEYSYAPDGSIASVRLVDAVTGDTYTPQGEVTTCPAGVEQPERDLVQLCDTATDGTVTVFLRDFARDENGAIAGHSDYTLDGAPYAPAGTVGVCPAESTCLNCTTHVLCDTDANPPATIAGTGASGTLPNGVGWTSTGPSALPASRQGDGAAWWGVALFPNPSVPTNLWTFDQIVTVEFSVLMVWSPGTGAGENTIQLPVGAVPVSLPPGYTYNRATGVLSADNTLTGCTLSTPTRAASARFRVTGVSSLSLRYLGTRAVNAECRTFGHWLFGALDVSLGGEFLRTVCRDCTGEVVSSTDTLLDGTTPYTPVGLVGVCQPEAEQAEPCRDSSSTLLCDTAAQEAIIVFDPANRPGSDGWQVVSFTGANPGYPPEAALPYDAPHPPGAFMGARTDLSAGPGPAWPGYDAAPHRWVLRKTFTAPEDGIASVSSVGFRGDGGARVRVNGVDAGMYGQWNQPATAGTAQIPVTAGPNTVEIEVRDGGGNNWVQGRLDIVMTRTQQFMRRTVVDCETGETVSVTDTTLDGEPYTVTGEVGQCEPVAECCEQPPPETRLDVETGELCLVDDDSGDVLGRVLVERIYDDQSGERIAQRYVDPVTGDPVDIPAGASVAVCPPEPCQDTYTTQVCDLPTGDPAGAPTATDTSATPYPWDADPLRCINAHPGGGQALWDGGTVAIPARSSGAGSCTPNQWLTGLAARLQADRPSCDSGTVTVTVAIAARNNGPSATAANYAGSIRLHRTDTGARLADSGNTTLASMPANTARTMTVTAVNVPAALLAAGQIVVALDVEAWDQTGNTGAAWLLSNFVAAYEFQQEGCETQFIRKIVTDCETGATVSVTDTTLDGEPYEVTGEVGQCTAAGGGECCPSEPCRNTSTLLVCDIPQDGSPDSTVTDTSGAPYYPYTTGVPAAGAQALWDGGTLTLPDAAGPQPGTTGTVRTAAAIIQAPRPVCDAGTARVTVQVDVTQLGPDAGCRSTGFLGLYNGTGEANRVALALAPPDTPAGWSGTLTAEADVPADDLAAGNIAVLLAFDAYDDSGATCPPPRRTGWQLSELGATVVYDQAGCETQILRTVVTDCESGEIVTVTDTTLDGQPYTVTGEVGQCTAAGGGECCPPPPPEPRIDVETTFLCIRDAGGEITGQVLVEHVYDDQTGERTEQRLTDPTTGDPVTLPAGAELVVCNEPACPVAFATECVGVVERTEASYDNTSLIGGEPGQCGGVQGPNGQFPCQPTVGAFTITSWIVDGVEVIGEGGGRTFAGGPCGDGTAASPGMHRNWSQALTNLDPSGAVWSAQNQPGCAWFVGSTGGTRTTYGPMTIEDAAGQRWILSTAQACEETQFTKVYTQECDGTVSVSWLDANGVATDAPDGEQVPCGTGCSAGGGRGLDVEPLVLCDVQADGTSTPFLRHISYGTGGVVSVVIDTGLDGFTPYTPAGTVGVCSTAPEEEPCGDTEVAQLCDLTYDPQAPIPTPASAFTLTGNVVAANNGTTLWFAQANQPANGVAELTVSGLLPATLYEFRFASAWIGAGGPDPANNNAIYRLDVLDGATVLATRTRNVSNGSNVFPGGVLSEDLPPLAFIAPATGAVTIRFTDQTTGGPVNDRDLFLMPLEVRTAALTLKSTPFLRRFTFDCNGGLTSTQDLGLDGTTPYVVQGEAGQCTADGATAGTVTPCDGQNVIEACRCDDTDGDGLPDTGYVELLAVDCEGTLSSLGTYTEGLTEPYTPVAPVDCSTLDEAEGAEPAFGVQARRVELAAGASWNAATRPTLQSVTAVAHGGNGTITTTDGASRLHAGESATWSVARDSDAALTGPLTIRADTGTVTITWTEGVQL